jgi:xylulose-5-phosphate/fructose-6-phosphate phosphoketolase
MDLVLPMASLVINAETPGAIHEGGELGYALSVAFGAVMDKPDLIVACVVGDGEAESGPTATSVITKL